MKLAMVALCGLTLLPIANAAKPQGDELNGLKERSIALFLESAKTYRHPRCLNCHPAGDQPMQGGDANAAAHAHIMSVTRGADDHGSTTMRCNSCHGESNYKYSNVPGAPHWGLAPKSMAWQGLTDRELCLQLKDPKRNGGKSLAEIVDHNANDKLVAWGWNPGGNREPAPGTQASFGRIVAEWVDTGAHCPPK